MIALPLSAAAVISEAAAERIAAEPALEDMTLDDALDAIAAVDAYLAKALPAVNEAHAARQRLLDLVAWQMNQTNALVKKGKHNVARWESLKAASASVKNPDELRRRLHAMDVIVPADLDAALPLVTPPPAPPPVPYVKADLRKTRKLADYGDAVAEVIDEYIDQPKPRRRLVVEPLLLNVTPNSELTDA